MGKDAKRTWPRRLTILKHDQLVLALSTKNRNQGLVMFSRLLLFVLVVLVLSLWPTACSQPPAPGSHPSDGRYEGPEWDGAIIVVDSMPPRLRLHVWTTVPSGGFQLGHDDTIQVGNRTEVLLTLTEPEYGEPVTMALEQKELLLDLGDTTGPVDVRVSRVQRGVHYVMAPPHLKALSVAR